MRRGEYDRRAARIGAQDHSCNRVLPAELRFQDGVLSGKTFRATDASDREQLVWIEWAREKVGRAKLHGFDRGSQTCVLREYYDGHLAGVRDKVCAQSAR